MNGLDFPRVGVLPSGPLDAITDVATSASGIAHWMKGMSIPV